MRFKTLIIINSLTLLFIIIAGWSFAITNVSAQIQDYAPLEPLPYYGYQTVSGESYTLSVYLETVFAFGISLAGILAVLMIVVGGMQYIIAYGNPGQVEKAKDRITQALYGLLLAVCAWLILNTINPDFVKGTLDLSSYGISSTNPYEWGGTQQGF